MMMLLFSLSLAGSGASSIDQLAGFQEARSLYYRGADGDKKAYDEADQRFSELYRVRPADPRVKAYYGSLRLLEASHTWAVWKKNSLSKQGIELLDAAVNAAPSNLEVRFVRAATTYQLPAFFRRKEQSKQDFAILAQHAAEAARDHQLEPRLAAASLYYHAEFLSQDGDQAQAAKLWQQAIQIAPDSRAARESRAALGHSGG